MTFILNFHGIGEAVRPMETGEDPYWISTGQFEQCLDLAAGSGRDIAFTFDDGNASDCSIALPILQARGLSAMSFVLAGKLDQPGYLSTDQVRHMAQTDTMRIGSHGMDHVPWPELSDSELDRELAESRSALERICEYDMDEAGLPFGRYDGRVLRRLKQHGYRRIYSSDGSEKLSKASPIPRFSVRYDTNMDDLASMMRGTGLVRRTRNEARAFLKSLR